MSYKDFGNPKYGITKNLGKVNFEEAREKVIDAFKEQGFGLQTEMNLKETFKKKLDTDFREYRILGFCHPHVAFQALGEEPAIGLLLPCNVCLATNESGDVIVSGVDPMELFKVIGRDDIKEMAGQIREQIGLSIDSL